MKILVEFSLTSNGFSVTVSPGVVIKRMSQVLIPCEEYITGEGENIDRK